MVVAAENILSANQNESDLVPALALIRCSTEEQGEEHKSSIGRQETAIAAIAQREGLRIVETIYAIGLSGTDVLQDGRVLKILAAVEGRIVGGLVVEELTRLTRPDDWSAFSIYGPFARAKARIWTNAQVFDFSSTSGGMLIPGIHALLAAQELSVLKERVRQSKEVKRKRGEAPNNSFPKGVSADPQTRRLVYTAEILVVREIGRLFDEEGIHNYREIARRIQGVSAPTVRRTLGDPIYTGFREYRSRRSGKKRVSKSTGKVWREREARPTQEIIRVSTGLEPIFDEATFARRLRIMAEMKTNYIERRSNTSIVHIASGLVRCWCGSPLLCSATSSRGIRRGYFSCRRNTSPYKKKVGGCSQPHLKDTDVDSGVWNLATGLLSDPERLASIFKTALKRTEETIHPFPLDQEAELKKLRGQRDRLLDAYQEGDISLETLRERRMKIEARMGQIENSRPALPVSVDVEGLVRRIIQGVALLPKVKDNFERKKLIHALFAEVRIEKRHIVGFRLHPDFATTGDEYLDLDAPLRIAPEPPPEGHSTCSFCSRTLPLEAFYAGRKSQCKACVRAATTRRRISARRSQS